MDEFYIGNASTGSDAYSCGKIGSTALWEHSFSFSVILQKQILLGLPIHPVETSSGSFFGNTEAGMKCGTVCQINILTAQILKYFNIWVHSNDFSLCLSISFLLHFTLHHFFSSLSTPISCSLINSYLFTLISYSTAPYGF